MPKKRLACTLRRTYQAFSRNSAVEALFRLFPGKLLKLLGADVHSSLDSKELVKHGARVLDGLAKLHGLRER